MEKASRVDPMPSVELSFAPEVAATGSSRKELAGGLPTVPTSP